MAKTFSDLSTDAKTRGNKLGTQGKGLISFDHAVLGPGVVQDPDNRIMTGCITPAHGTEQAAAVTSNNPNRFKSISDTGKTVS